MSELPAQCARCRVLLGPNEDFWMSGWRSVGCFDCWLSERVRKEEVRRAQRSSDTK